MTGVWRLGVALAAMLYGCAPVQRPTIIVEGKPYATAQEALVGVQNDYRAYALQLPHASAPIQGTALIVVPDHDRLRPLVEHEYYELNKKHLSGEALEVAAEVERIVLTTEGISIEGTGTFASATLRVQNDTLNPDMGSADYLVWYEVRTTRPDNQGTWEGAWQVRRAGNSDVRTATIDPGADRGTPRLASLVASVRSEALAIGTAPPQQRRERKTAAREPEIRAGMISSGSGIVVDTDGRVLTNAHVVADCESPRVIDSADEKHAGHVLARDAENDLALVKADGVHWQSAATFRPSGELRLGETVTATGFPLPNMLSSEMSVTSGTLSSLVGIVGDTSRVTMTTPVQPGNSGGPLFDEHGDVVGVVVARLNAGPRAILAGAGAENVNFAIKASGAMSFLAAHRVAYQPAARHPAETTADLAAAARPITVQIICQH